MNKTLVLFLLIFQVSFAQTRKETVDWLNSNLENYGDNQFFGTYQIEIKNGRYGPYITNQKINAPFPKDKNIDSMELNVALEIIAAKKAKGPTKFRRRKK